MFCKSNLVLIFINFFRLRKIFISVNLIDRPNIMFNEITPHSILIIDHLIGLLKFEIILSVSLQSDELQAFSCLSTSGSLFIPLSFAFWSYMNRKCKDIFDNWFNSDSGWWYLTYIRTYGYILGRITNVDRFSQPPFLSFFEVSRTGIRKVSSIFSINFFVIRYIYA